MSHSTTHITALANFKGGVGKTTSTLFLASLLAQHKVPVLVVDLDQQANLTTALAPGTDFSQGSVYHTITKKLYADDCIYRLKEYLFLMPASPQLRNLDTEMSQSLAREHRLDKALKAWSVSKDRPGFEQPWVVLLDCPPSSALATVNALAAAQSVLITTQPEYFSADGLGNIFSFLTDIQEEINPGIEQVRILITMFVKQTLHHKEMLEALQDLFKQQLCNTVVRRSIKVSDLVADTEGLLNLKPAGSPVVADYQDLLAELIPQFWPDVKL